MSQQSNGKATETAFYTLQSGGRPLQSFFSYEKRKILNPPWFQGNRETENYFEGWYFKNVSADGKNTWAFIPGVSLVNGDEHAFIQVINGQTGDTYYYRYPADSFSFSSSGFEICVGQSYFSDKMLVLDMDNGKDRFKGVISFEDVKEYPVWYKRPGIMGWYRYVPSMECYHGVVSLDHLLHGEIMHNNTTLNFEQGRGYIEKDWGSSMPKAWVWMQSNHFGQEGTSFMMSVARIPWIGNTFTGFLGFLFHEDSIISFATYTGAQVKDFRYSDKDVQLTIRGKKYIIDVHAVKSSSHFGKTFTGGLKAPVFGNMERMIHESIDAEIHVHVKDKKGKTIFQDTGKHAGFEMVGYMELLKK